MLFNVADLHLATIKSNQANSRNLILQYANEAFG